MNASGVTGTRVATVAAVTGLVSAVLWQVRSNQGHLVPTPSLIGGVLLVLLVVFVLALAWPVRRYLRGRATRPLDPVRASRALVFAQAGALTGGAVAGWYAAQFVIVLRALDLHAYQSRAWQLGLCVVAAGLLAAAGLIAQNWCRVSPPDEESRPGD